MLKRTLKALLVWSLFAGGFQCVAQESGASASARNERSAAPAASALGARTDIYSPLTQEERTKRYIRSLTSAESILRAAAGAGISQATNTPAEWGQGAEGYGLRVANSYGQHFVRQTLLYGGSSLLNEDNRYFPSGRTGVGHRALYAIESTFLARRPDGTRRLSYSRIAAVVGTAFISREWQPHSTNGAQNALYSMGNVFGSEVGFNVAREFLPNILGH